MNFVVQYQNLDGSIGNRVMANCADAEEALFRFRNEYPDRKVMAIMPTTIAI